MINVVNVVGRKVVKPPLDGADGTGKGLFLLSKRKKVVNVVLLTGAISPLLSSYDITTYDINDFLNKEVS